MKDIKSMIIGFLLATCMFLFMGNTENDKQVDESKIVSALNDINLTLIEGNKNGRYQSSGDNYHGAHIIDTKTGEYWLREKVKGEFFWNKYIESEFYDSKTDFKNANK